MTKHPHVYILASKKNGTLYIGVTSKLVQRIWQHKNNQSPGFAEKYQVHTLVYYEAHEIIESAITREKQIKNRSVNRRSNLSRRKTQSEMTYTGDTLKMGSCQRRNDSD